MTSIIKFCALSGALDDSPHSYLLKVDDFTFLLDCGWDEKCSEGFIHELKKHVNKIDAVLLSYPDQLHLGALPYAVGKLGLTCPVYATVPVYKMGQMFMYDWYQSKDNMEDFDLFTLDDVDNSFDKVVQLKYSQSVPLKGKGQGLIITPLPAGHMLGGTVWKIVKDGEEDIIYAVDYNHKKERHLNGCELEKIQRPSLLITDAYNTLYAQPRRRSRDEKLMTNILQTLRGGGNVLVAVDTAGRVLELAHMLEQLWRNQESGLRAYSLALLNNVAYNVNEFAKSQIEWMSDKLMKSFEGARNNPFGFKYLQLCHTLPEVLRIAGSKVVLSSCPDLECGFARDLFALWCSDARNSIILTSRSGQGTLGQRLHDQRNLKSVTLELKQRVKLEGAELEEFRRKEREQNILSGIKIKDQIAAESSESEDEVKKGRHDIVVRSDDKTTGAVQHFFKSSKKHPTMFPYFEDKIKFDEYGEIIRPEDYVIAESEDHEMADYSVEKPKWEEEPEAECPTKCISTTTTLAINASIMHIDFEGRSDGESIIKLIESMKPKRTIVVRGSSESCQALQNLCLSTGSSDNKAFIARKGETIDATIESHIYQVRLKDSLLSSLLFGKAKDAEVAWIDARLTYQAEDLRDLDDKENNSLRKEQAPLLEPLEPKDIPGHETSYINELKLSDFKQVLVRNGISSEFIGGVLWCCNGNVALRRNESGRVTLEGCISDDYYRVRELLYEQYAII
ncbi:probable cleavage and polyadenylation specificity factor subunit 2 isoform X2 [Daphnia pulicaria]|uniref:probable cleavage and polyadenylation specificity factor subunit 2 isoform X2 n=1 Tax=Daphnia pulicaria TaxID=35523 RepID=UPI001EEC03D5|nr:probable cleavage and polyadenylation specificity factor subunit 2 isoform X2 [Daphnia pulicaria]